MIFIDFPRKTRPESGGTDGVFYAARTASQSGYARNRLRQRRATRKRQIAAVTT